MTKYNFYYDESSHSRKINYKTITSKEYYDNFITVIVGWPSHKEEEIKRKYLAFEEKYSDRKNADGELKSVMFKKKDFTNGLASMNKFNIQVLNDFLSIFSEDISVYLSVYSKIEYIIFQLLLGYYKNSNKTIAEMIIYTIVKSLNTYRPTEVIKNLCDKPENFIFELRKFYQKQINIDMQNYKLKEAEIDSFKNVIAFLDDISYIPNEDWDYRMPFSGFELYLEEKNIDEYSLMIDKEGKINEDSSTMKAAVKVGLINVSEGDSKQNFGLRMADMFAGILFKLIKSINDALIYKSQDDGINYKMLSEKWFKLKTDQLNAYKKLNCIICEWDNAWYKSYTGIYPDNLICLSALLQYISRFDKCSDLRNSNKKDFNNELLNRITDYFERMISGKKNENQNSIVKTDIFFLNAKGAKVYNNIVYQPWLEIKEGDNVFKTLSVGIHSYKNPLITIEENNTPVCYRLPLELTEWTYMMMDASKLGRNIFPKKVNISLNNNKYTIKLLD